MTEDSVPAGSGSYTVRHHFDNADGRNPYGSLMEWGGRFYGMTLMGGNNNLGVLFEYDPAGGGNYAVKRHFSGADGGLPYGSLAEWDGKLYGMTSVGGNSSLGVLFEYNPAEGGNYAVRKHFDYADGINPYGSLMEWGGKLYGMTSEGGSFGNGVLFEFDPTGTGSYAVRKHFNNADGMAPHGSLIEWDGKLYGMTSSGGSNYVGVLFEFDPAGSGAYTVKHHFDGTDGRTPFDSLTEWNGKFYGMTREGGNRGRGVVFEYDPAGSGSYTVLKHLGGADGANPIYGHLIAVEDNASSTPSIHPTYGFALYPNPTTGELNLALSSCLGKGLRIEVYNVQGQLLHFKEVDKVLTDVTRLDLRGYKPGMYVVRVRTEGSPDAVRMFVVQ